MSEEEIRGLEVHLARLEERIEALSEAGSARHESTKAAIRQLRDDMTGIGQRLTEHMAKEHGATVKIGVFLILSLSSAVLALGGYIWQMQVTP